MLHEEDPASYRIMDMTNAAAASRKRSHVGPRRPRDDLEPQEHALGPSIGPDMMRLGSVLMAQHKILLLSLRAPQTIFLPTFPTPLPTMLTTI